MNEIRWTDKVYLDSQGNIRSSDGCPTDQNVSETKHNPCDYCIELECENHGVVCPFYKEEKEAKNE